MEDITMKAQKFAAKKHYGQQDDTKQPYITHPEKVAKLVRTIYPNDLNLICAAYLHDTIEDTDTTYEELIEEFNQDVADLVMEVTHEGTKDDYGFYFPRLKTQRGIVLKFADRLHNLTRMETWDKKRIDHYLKKSKFWKDVSDLNQ